MFDEPDSPAIGSPFRRKFFKEDGLAIGANDIKAHRVFTRLKNYVYVVHWGRLSESHVLVCDRDHAGKRGPST
jgi:hypothetical protein